MSNDPQERLTPGRVSAARTQTARRHGRRQAGNRSRRRRPLPLLAATLLLIGAFTLLSSGTGRAGAAVKPFSMSTGPAMVPSFNPKITDYAVRCTTRSTTHLVTQGSGPVTVGGKVYPSAVSINMPLVANQAVQVTAGGNSYYIRCLPKDFPTYTATRPRTPVGIGVSGDPGQLHRRLRHQRSAGVVGHRSREHRRNSSPTTPNSSTRRRSHGARRPARSNWSVSTARSKPPLAEARRYWTPMTSSCCPMGTISASSRSPGTARPSPASASISLHGVCPRRRPSSTMTSSS